MRSRIRSIISRALYHSVSVENQTMYLCRNHQCDPVRSHRRSCNNMTCHSMTAVAAAMTSQSTNLADSRPLKCCELRSSHMKQSKPTPTLSASSPDDTAKPPRGIEARNKAPRFAVRCHRGGLRASGRNLYCSCGTIDVAICLPFHRFGLRWCLVATGR